MTTYTPHASIPGWGSDIDRETRPGVPKERSSSEPSEASRWGRLEAQDTVRGSLVSKTREITPVYSSAVPPRGLSGWLRRRAYEIPEYRPRRWLMLMFADRVDAMEHRPVRSALAVAGLGAVLFGALALFRRRA